METGNPQRAKRCLPKSRPVYVLLLLLCSLCHHEIELGRAWTICPVSSHRHHLPSFAPSRHQRYPWTPIQRRNDVKTCLAIVSDQGDSHDAERDERGRDTSIQGMDSASIIILQPFDGGSSPDSTCPSFSYLQELGLPETAMTKIQSLAPSVPNMNVTTLRTRINVLKNTMKLSDEDLCALITAQPSLLQLSATRNVSPTILFLVRQLDLGIQELKTLVLGCPALLTYSISNLQQKIGFFRYILQYNLRDTRDLLLTNPGLLRSSPQTGMLPRLQFYQKSVGVSIAELRGMFKKHPPLLGLSVKNNLQPKLDTFFLETLELQPKEVKKIVLAYPPILNLHMERNLLPMVYLLQTWGLSGRECGRMLHKYPRLVTHANAKIQLVVDYLQSQLRLEDVDLRRILLQAPSVVGLSMETIETKLDFLWETLGRTPNSTRQHPEEAQILRKVIVSAPTQLYLSIEHNLAPKVDYLSERMGTDAFVAAVLKKPPLLGYSLQTRIRPRLEKILAAGLDVSSLLLCIAKTEAEFETWFERRLESGSKSTPREQPEHVTQDPPTLRSPDAKSQISLENGREDDKGRIIQDGGSVVHWVR